MSEGLASASLTLAVAMAAGVGAQALARRLHLPGIVLLLAVGVLLGPDAVNLLRPSALGDALPGVIGFGVAVVLFEGGMNQNLGRLRKQAVAIRRLVTLGAFITAAGGGLAAHLILGWDWRLSTLFGTLVIVTGPTVITPLLRRIHVTGRVETVLEAEGIFIDAVGAIIAVAALDFCLSPSAISLTERVFELGLRIAVGGAVGVAGGAVLYLCLDRLRSFPEGLENIFALSVAVLTFETGNAVMPESGIVAAIACGMVVGNSGMTVLRQLTEFKEQLTVLLIAVLFVLLAADVRIADVYALGLPGLATVAALMFVVRPLSVFACTFGTELRVRERLFLSWLAPRGIVAAAVASLFALELAAAGIPGGREVRALVFLVIGVTVFVQGGTGRWVARLLRVERPGPEGFVIVGAHAIGRAIARALVARNRTVVLVDTSREHLDAASGEGFETVAGNALWESTLLKAKLAGREALVCATTSGKLNFMIGRLVADEHAGPDILVALSPSSAGVTPAMLEAIGARPLRGNVPVIEHWLAELSGEAAQVETWRWTGKPIALGDSALHELPSRALLPLVVAQADEVVVVSAGAEIAEGAEVDFALRPNARSEAVAWLRRRGWAPTAGPESAAG